MDITTSVGSGCSVGVVDYCAGGVRSIPTAGDTVIFRSLFPLDKMANQRSALVPRKPL